MLYIEFRNLTCLDYAHVTKTGHIKGKSLNVSVSVFGKITGKESVILDFSKGKKEIKQIIDDKFSGFDHKLVIFPNSEIKMNMVDNNLCEITSSNFNIRLPYDNLREGSSYCINKCIEELLQEKMPEYKFKVSTEEKGFTKSNTYFNYIHSLKNSSAWGCQGVHGHTSFVEVISSSQELDTLLQSHIANMFDGKLIAFKENVVFYDSNKIELEIDTCERGTIFQTFENTPYLIIDTETTIEYMVQYAVSTFASQLKNKTLTISEGLMKGASIKC